ncbi:MAG: radical SAM protein [Candidatus Aenigmarchaeota archaeon]|nr:radical SAM protein [Candidatus Aenigmarchaeota archaeon]
MADWPLTFKCNNNCISCIYNLEMAEKLKVGNPMEKEIKKTIDGIKPNDILSFTGGEPTIRKEFFKFLRYAAGRDSEMNIAIVSNGRMFCYDEFVDKMLKTGLKNLKFCIALYGHNERLHDAITRTPGSFEQTIKGIRNLLKRSLPVELRVIISKMNYKYLKDIANFVMKNLNGVHRVVFINMKYTGNAYINRKAIFVRYKDVVPYTEKAADILLESNIEVKLFHFPLCTIKKKYWDLAKGVTKQKSELMFVSECKECKKREECPMIWKSYWVLAGDKEFKAFRK